MRFVILIFFILGITALSFWAGYEVRSVTVSNEMDDVYSIVSENKQDEIDRIKNNWRKIIMEMTIAHGMGYKEVIFSNLDNAKLLLRSDPEDVKVESSKIYAANFILMKLSLKSWNDLGIEYDHERINSYIQTFKTVDSLDPPGMKWSDFRNQLIDEVESLMGETQQVDSDADLTSGNFHSGVGGYAALSTPAFQSPDAVR